MSINIRTLLSKAVSAIKEKLGINSFTWGEFETKLDEAVNGADAFSKRLFEDSTIKIKFEAGQHQLPDESENVADVNLVIPEGIEEVRKFLFANVRDIGTITFPNTLKTIRWGAFQNLYTGKPLHITFGNNLETIEEYAFYSCSMGTLVFPDSLKTIKSYAFGNCTYNLISVKMGSGINDIEDRAFDNCNILEEVDFSKCSAVPTCGKNSFANCSYKLKIKVPSALLSQWKAADVWKDYSDKIIGV